MTDQAFETRTDQINISPVAAAKVKSLLEQEGRDDLALRISSSRAGVPACATSCSSTSGPSTATSRQTSTASASSLTG